MTVGSTSEDQTIRWAPVSTPIGTIAVGASDQAVVGVRLAGDAECGPAPPTGVLAQAVTQLTEYFTGQRTSFDLPVAVPEQVGSQFDRAVWTELLHIPYGEQRTYGQVAAAIGDRGAARAVGAACNRNPLPLVVPCHRVVGAGGKLVGFGGGLPAKRWLLEHEARVALARDWA